MICATRFASCLASAVLFAAVVSAVVIEKPIVAKAAKAVGPVEKKSVISSVEAKAPKINGISRQVDDSATPGLIGGGDIAMEPESAADMLIPESADEVFMTELKKAGADERGAMLDMLKVRDGETMDEKLANFKELVLQSLMTDENPEPTGEETIVDDDDTTGDVMDPEAVDAIEDSDAELDEDMESETEDESAGGDEADAEDFIETGPDSGQNQEKDGKPSKSQAVMKGFSTGPKPPSWSNSSNPAVQAAEAARPGMSVEAWEEVKDRAKKQAEAMA